MTGSFFPQKSFMRNLAEKTEPGFCPGIFPRVTWESYPDHLVVPDAQPLISYILSCHGNQNQYILDHYKEFRSFVEKKTEHGFHITKDARLFLCEKVTNLKKL